MAQADDLHTTSRRSFLAATAALPTVAGIAALAQASPPASDHPDARLLQLGKQFVEAWRHERMLDAKYGYEESPEITREFEEPYDRIGRVVDLIEKISAISMAGLRIKAAAVLWCHSGDMDLWNADTRDERIAKTIIRDLLTAHPLAVA
jgi:hypothetical protein